MAFPLLVVFGFITKPPTMIRLFAELFGHYPSFAKARGRTVRSLTAGSCDRDGRGLGALDLTAVKRSAFWGA
jgi:hypothetical protein